MKIGSPPLPAFRGSPPLPAFQDSLLTCNTIYACFRSVQETSDPIQLSYYLFVFICGLVFWRLVLLGARLHEVENLAKLFTSITIINLYGCLLAPFMKLPLLVRFLVLFQASGGLVLLSIWAFLSLKAWMNSLDPHTQQQQISLTERQAVICCLGWLPQFCGANGGYILKSGGKVDEVGGNGSGHGSGASGRQENRGRYGGNDRGGGAVGGGDIEVSGSGHDSGARGSDEKRGGDEGHGQDDGVTGSGASLSRENIGGNDDGDKGWDWGGSDPERGGSGMNTKQAPKSYNYNITEMSLMLTAQTTSTLIGYHITPTKSSSSHTFLVVVLMVQLVAYLCGLTSILLSSSGDEAYKISQSIALGFTALGFILMVAMFAPWYFVLIAVLLFGVVLLILYWNELKTRATEFWNKNARK